MNYLKQKKAIPTGRPIKLIHINLIQIIIKKKRPTTIADINPKTRYLNRILFNKSFDLINE